MEFPEQGYPESRFSAAVDEDLHCAICLNVLRDPLQCEMNEHHFCSPCIKQHLHNTLKCPSCMEDLSLKTLRKPARYLTKHLGSLIIQCDYESRGCPEFVKLEDLPRHISDCGYAPVSCQNDGCHEVVNKQDKIRHETETCGQRGMTCQDGIATRKEINDLKVCLEQLVKEVNGLKVSFDDFKAKEANEGASKKIIGELKVAFEELIRKEINDLKTSFEEFKVKKENNEEHLRKDIDELKVAFEKLSSQVCLVRGAKSTINKPCPSPTNENVIVVIGGYNGHERLTSTEMYLWSQKKWLPLPKTSQPHSAPSAGIFENQIFVAGGKTGEQSLTDRIEAINLNTKPMEWFKLPGKLPHPSHGQSCTVYQDHLIVIGGSYIAENDDNLSDSIYKISLQPPYTCNLLATLPSPRSYHKAELFGDKIVIIGGFSKQNVCERSVLSYNLATRKYLEISQLQNGISNMATISLGENVVVVGGRNNNGKVLDTVEILNIKTGKINRLPPMKYKRSNCTAVVISNHIVVMGGYNNGRFLNNVEYFSFSTYAWTELPPMNQARSAPGSVVTTLPFNHNLNS